MTLYAITYANGSFLAGGSSGAIVTSVDGVNWSPRSGTSRTIHSLSYGNGTYVAATGFSSDVGRMFSSVDAVTWTIRFQGRFPGDTTENVTFGNGIFLTTGDFAGTMVSSDGMNWTTNSPDRRYRVGYGNGIFVGVGGVGIIATTTDGGAWNRHVTPAPLFNDVAYGNGLWVAVSENRFCARSADGIYWTTNYQGTNWPLKDIMYANGRFVAVGQQVLVSSADGANWTVSSAEDHFYSVAYGNGAFITVGNNGSILTSPDGVSWESRREPSANIDNVYLYGVAYGNSRFVAVGSYGISLISTDTVAWVNRNMGTTEWLRGVSFGNGLFVAVDRAGTSYVSPDGLIWTNRPAGPSGSPSGNGESTLGGGIIYGNGSYVATTGTARMLSSTNGLDWISHDIVAGPPLNGVAFDGNTFVAAGGNGILQSDPLLSLGIQRALSVELIVKAPVGRTVRIEALDALGVENRWFQIGEFIIPASPYSWIDPNSTERLERFYRAVMMP
jgi:hypothetical protein